MHPRFLFAAALLLLACTDKKAGPEIPPEPPPPSWACQWTGEEAPDGLDTLGCDADYALLEGAAPDGPFGQMRTIKILYSLADSTLHWANSTRFELHFDFAVAALGYPADAHRDWDAAQYRHNPDRQYLLGSVNYYRGAGQWALEFYAGDDVVEEHMRAVFEAARTTAWFGDSLRFFPANDVALQRARRAAIPVVTEQEIYGAQQFQCLNSGEAYGYLTRALSADLPTGDFNRRAIIFTEGVPLDMPVVAGIVTAAFQTPLSHINVLSRNRGTPNMALRTVWSDSLFRGLEGQLVHLQVRLDGYNLELADTAAARAFWDSTGPGTPPILSLDTTSDTLVHSAGLRRGALPAVGAKAANFGELMELAARNPSHFAVPTGAFAIPSVHYRRHLERHGLWAVVDSLLADDAFRTQISARRLGLEILQERIRAAPVDSLLVESVRERMLLSGHTSLRFRSSTNAEDLREFNGAGLYASFTGELHDSVRTVQRAIARVWASLWGIRAFEERDFFGIDHRRASMGILAHRNFPAERANGVALTHNIYQPEYWGLVVNVQVGETSVVEPPGGVTCEQFIYYPWERSQSGDLSVRYFSRSSLTGGVAVLSEQEIEQLGLALLQIHEHFYPILAQPGEPYWQFGMDVEFKLDGTERRLYIKQARPLGSL